jgi:hypothetical protein
LKDWAVANAKKLYEWIFGSLRFGIKTSEF